MSKSMSTDDELDEIFEDLSVGHNFEYARKAVFALIERERREAEIETLKSLPMDRKSLLDDLCYQGPDAPKRYKIEITNYYKGWNDYLDIVKLSIERATQERKETPTHE